MNACATEALDTRTIAGVLQTVDCHARTYAQSGYEALGATGSPFQAWLTALLVIYVAAIGYRLLLGSGVRLAEMPLTALKIGTILTLTSNWSLFQTLVFDLAFNAPMELVRIITAPAARESAFAGDPMGALQVTYEQLNLSAAAFGQAAGLGASPFSNANAAAAQALWEASRALFFATAGLFSVAIVLAAALTALGPVFIGLALVPATRGLFEGWARAMLATLIVPLLCWICAALMLMILEPSLLALAQARLTGKLNVETALAVSSLVMIFALAQIVLAAVSVMMAWGLRLPRPSAAGSRARAAPASPSTLAVVDAIMLSRPQQLAARLNQEAASQAGAAFAVMTAASGTSGFETQGRNAIGYRRAAVRHRREFRGAGQ